MSNFWPRVVTMNIPGVLGTRGGTQPFANRCLVSLNKNKNNNFGSVCVCVCFLPIHSGHQVRWTYQPGSHRRKVTQDF